MLSAVLDTGRYQCPARCVDFTVKIGTIGIAPTLRFL